MGKISIDLGVDDTEEENLDAVKELAKGLPSTSAARHQVVRQASRTQMNFSNVPVPIKEAFEAEASKSGMGLKEFFYHCLRAGGVDVPSYEQLDGRRR